MIDTPWLLLIHQIPPKPDYLRVKIGRRLQRVGAIPVKNSVYLLPDGPDHLEDFQWIRTEIVAGGGDATICRAELVEGLTDEEVRNLFRQARAAEFAEISRAALDLVRALDKASARSGRGTSDRTGSVDGASDEAHELARLRTRFAAIAALDFFDSPERRAAEEALDAVDARLHPRASERAGESRPAVGGTAYQARTWVTRQDVFIDRIASAWLIRRFIDPEASFVFAPALGYRPKPGELRFDMVGAEFTHEGDRCTFEVLVERFGLAGDAALVAISEIVHDIDLKDEKYGRAETPGVAFVVTGIAAAHADDPSRLERGAAVLDDLYALLSRESPAPGTAG